MKTSLLAFCFGLASISFGQSSSSLRIATPVMGSPLVSFDQFETLADSVEVYRENRLISAEKFVAFSEEKNTVILDTRSKFFFDKKHVKGAINLPFADFTQDNLEKVIPSKDTRILIYCNNNFMADEYFIENQYAMIEDPSFVSKQSLPHLKMDEINLMNLVSDSLSTQQFNPVKNYTLALNIPTFINLYGYGYSNIYELGEMVATANSSHLQFEGTELNRKGLKVTLSPTKTASLVKYSDLQELIEFAKPHREQRLISLDDFNAMKLDANTIMLDARSKEMYDAKHVKGAIHLEFSEFTQSTLDELTGGDRNKRILIYCNNNFITDKEKMQQDRYFMSKVALFPPKFMTELTLALNIPTYINLYGYGFQNVYELNELVVTSDPRIEFEGTSIK